MRQSLWGERPGGIFSADLEITLPSCEKPLPRMTLPCIQEQSFVWWLVPTKVSLQIASPSWWVCAFWWGGWIEEAVTGLKVRNGKSVKFLWAVDFPSRFQTHFREKTTANRAASLPPGSSSDPPLSSQRVTGAQMQTSMGYRSQVCHPGQAATTASSGGRVKVTLAEITEPHGKKCSSEGTFSIHHWRHLNH